MKTAHTARATRFATAYALLRAGADVGDHLVNAANAVSKLSCVSPPWEIRPASGARASGPMSRLAVGSTVCRIAFVRVAGVAA